MEQREAEACKRQLLSQTAFTMQDLLTIMTLLRSRWGCAWDREQTHESIRPNLLEEAYEVAEGIDLGDSALLCEELGDLLLQVVFHAAIAEDSGEFTFDDVVSGICTKLLVRHPHVFGDEHVDTAEQMIEKWEEIKAKTKQHRSLREDMDGVAKTLPALSRAQKIAKKAMRGGLAVEMGKEMTQQELGQTLFALCAMAQRQGIDAEEALRLETEKRIREAKE